MIHFSLKTFLLCLVGILAIGALKAQQSAVPQAAAQPDPAPPAPEAKPEAPEGEGQRTSLNLLGKENSASGEARRNENVTMTLIDNNVLKELNLRVGTTATIIDEFNAERSYFGKEYGGSPPAPLHLTQSNARATHGELNWSHNNSIFSARSFFQAGSVQPARSNEYGAAFSSGLWKGGHLSLTAGQRKLRGMVNGNILVPSANERTPTATDPAALAIVRSVLAAYPAQLPNRTDISPRALNANAPQNIDDNRLSGTANQAVGSSDRLTLRYNLTLQQVEAFELVGGQNPDTTTKNHDARISWTRTWSAATIADFSAGYDRVGSLLVAEETALPHSYQFQRILETLGPTSTVPIDRAQNTYRTAGRIRHNGGAHALTAGFDLSRRQINGSESNDHRGAVQFRRDFGRDMMQNLLAGTPTSYRQSVGDAHRGFRAWAPLLFVNDNWTVAGNFSLHFGLRYEPSLRPTEANHLSEIPYPCDCNNFAPTFGFAYKAGDRLGLFRGAYGLHYGEIFGVTYMQSRFSPPNVVNLNLIAPDLVNPLGVFSFGVPAGTRTDYFKLDSHLVTPYSHQYNFSWETHPFGAWVLDLGYVGSRSNKLFHGRYTNRARMLPGIDPTSQNVNQRRLDPRYSDILYTSNASRSFYDAGKATLRMPRRAGLNFEVSYWWSKSIDLGGDYTNTSYGQDARNSRSPAEANVHQSMRAVSNFDQPHALLMNLVYETPRRPAWGWVGNMMRSWQFAAVALIKSGVPFTVDTGSDAPGFGNVDGVSEDRPDLADVSVLGAIVDHPDVARIRLPKSAFLYPTILEVTGNLGRNTFRKDGIANINASMIRTFQIRKGKSLQFRAESINLTNHPQFEAPGFRLSEENFGQITNTLNDGRTFRFSLRLSF